jgi:hypothetical protein
VRFSSSSRVGAAQQGQWNENEGTYSDGLRWYNKVSAHSFLPSSPKLFNLTKTKFHLLQTASFLLAGMQIGTRQLGSLVYLTLSVHRPMRNFLRNPIRHNRSCVQVIRHRVAVDNFTKLCAAEERVLRGSCVHCESK